MPLSIRSRKNACLLTVIALMDLKKSYFGQLKDLWPKCYFSAPTGHILRCSPVGGWVAQLLQYEEERQLEQCGHCCLPCPAPCGKKGQRCCRSLTSESCHCCEFHACSAARLGAGGTHTHLLAYWSSKIQSWAAEGSHSATPRPTRALNSALLLAQPAAPSAHTVSERLSLCHELLMFAKWKRSSPWGRWVGIS